MLDVKLLNMKKVVSFLLLALCFTLVVVTTLGLIFNLTPNNVAVVRTTSGVIRLELTAPVTLDDNTKEKLAIKIKITSTGETGELGNSVRVTPKDVMFNYLVNDNEYYFKAIGNSLNTINEHVYRATASSSTIKTPKDWNTFVENVSLNTVYSTVCLESDLDFNGAFINTVGYGGTTPGTPFKGTFDGKNHTIKNFTMGKGIYSGTVGLFGQTENATIKNLNVEGATINFTNDYNEYEYAKNGYRDIQYAYGPNVIELFVGFIVGEMKGGTISNCRVSSTCSMIVKAVTYIEGDFDNNSSNLDKQFSQMIGGIAGGAYGTITNCESHANITAYNKNQREFCVSGICGGWAHYKQPLTVKNCLYKGKVKIVDESEDTNNPTYLSYGGILGGGYMFNYFYTSDSVSTVSISNCVAILDNFSLPISKSDAKAEFDLQNKENMTRCRYSFQPIFALFPVHHYPTAPVYRYCGYTYRKIKSNGETQNMHNITNCYYKINGNPDDYFFVNYAQLINSDKQTITAHFYNGGRFGYTYNV